MTVSTKAVSICAGLGALFLAIGGAQAAPYQKYLDGNCPVNANCLIDFPVIPAGKTVTLTNLSCYFVHDTNTSAAALQLVVFDGSGTRQYVVTPSLEFPRSLTKPGGGLAFLYQTNNVILAVGKGGWHFHTYASVFKNSDGGTGTVVRLSCGISGTID